MKKEKRESLYAERLSSMEVMTPEEIRKTILTARTRARKGYNYKEWLNVQQEGMEEFLSEKEALQEDLNKHEFFVDVKEEEHKKAIKELEEARKKVDKAKKILEEAKKYHKELEKKLTDMSEKERNLQKMLKQGELLTLVHRSASNTGIAEYQMSIIIINKCDQVELELLMPDVVVKANELEHLIDILPYDFKEKYNTGEQNSIIKYCELVANVKMAVDDDRKVKLLYSNSDIAQILKLNGIL